MCAAGHPHPFKCFSISLRISVSEKPALMASSKSTQKRSSSSGWPARTKSAAPKQVGSAFLQLVSLPFFRSLLFWSTKSPGPRNPTAMPNDSADGLSTVFTRSMPPMSAEMITTRVPHPPTIPDVSSGAPAFNAASSRSFRCLALKPAASVGSCCSRTRSYFDFVASNARARLSATLFLDLAAAALETTPTKPLSG